MARLPTVTPEDLPEEHRDLFEVDEENPDDVTVTVHQVWANNPALYEAWDEWAWALYDAVEDPRKRELAILAVAEAVQCRYVWHQHVELATEAGVSPDEIRALASDELGTFSPAECVLIEYATAAITGTVDDDLHEQLATHYDDATIVALLFLVTEYAQIDATIDALGIQLEEDFVGWELENAG